MDCSGPFPNPSSGQAFFPSLRVFNATENQLTGPLPEAFGQIDFFQAVCLLLVCQLGTAKALTAEIS